MKKKNLIAKTEITINAPLKLVWDALVNPDSIKKYMFGTTVISDWKEGSPIIWKGEWQGKSYEDKGFILQFEPQKVLKYSHFSPLTGLEDTPENYHTVTVHLSDMNKNVIVSLSQDHNPTEQAREHSEQNWEMMLEALRQFIENE